MATKQKTLPFNYFLETISYCSDFGNESNGIFELRWFFFSSDKFQLFDWPFLTECFCINQKVLFSELKSEKIFTCDHFSYRYGGLKIAILPNLGHS